MQCSKVLIAPFPHKKKQVQETTEWSWQDLSHDLKSFMSDCSTALFTGSRRTNTCMQETLQLTLLLMQDSTRITVLFAAAAASGSFQKRIACFKGLCCIYFCSNLRNKTLSYSSKFHWCSTSSESGYTCCLFKDFWLNNSMGVTNIKKAFTFFFSKCALWKLEWKTLILVNYIPSLFIG